MSVEQKIQFAAAPRDFNFDVKNILPDQSLALNELLTKFDLLYCQWSFQEILHSNCPKFVKKFLYFSTLRTAQALHPEV